MFSEEEISQQQQRLSAYRRTLHHYLQQKALQGASFIPPVVTHGIDDARENIRQLKEFLRQNGITVDDHPDDRESSQVALRGIVFSKDQLLWLSTLRSYSPNGEKVDRRKVLVELLGSIADDFDPKSIDNRFCRGGDIITILGRYIVDSNDYLVLKANTIALAIRDILRANPDKREISAPELVDITKMPELDVAVMLEVMAGYFHLAGTNYGVRGWASIRVDENDIFERYVKFQSIQSTVDTILEER
jgi:hypothetical protein